MRSLNLLGGILLSAAAGSSFVAFASEKPQQGCPDLSGIYVLEADGCRVGHMDPEWVFGNIPTFNENWKGRFNVQAGRQLVIRQQGCERIEFGHEGPNGTRDGFPLRDQDNPYFGIKLSKNAISGKSRTSTRESFVLQRLDNGDIAYRWKMSGGGPLGWLLGYPYRQKCLFERVGDL